MSKVDTHFSVVHQEARNELARSRNLCDIGVQACLNTARACAIRGATPNEAGFPASAIADLGNMTSYRL